ncbi:MAG: DUF4402 domain-containing protein [Acidobacteriota bacterium]
MNKKQFLAAAGAIAAFSAAAPANAATTTATIKASVLKPVQLTGGGTLDLGTILTPSSASFSGTFTVVAAASQTGTFCAAGFSCTGSPAAAMFNIQGTNKTNIGLNIPLSIVLTLQNYTGGGTTPTMAISTLNSIAANNTTGSYTMQVPNSGSPGLDFYVGGMLTVTQATVGGNYAGTVTVTADYN